MGKQDRFILSLETTKYYNKIYEKKNPSKHCMLSKAVTFKKWEVGSEQDELEDYSHLPLGEGFRVTEQGGETQSEPGAEGSKLEVPQRQDGRRSQHLRDGGRCLGRNATDLPGVLSRILLTATDQGAPVRDLPET